MQHSVRRSFSTQTCGNRTLQQREKTKFTPSLGKRCINSATKLDKKMVVNKFQSSFLKDFCFFAKQCITNCLTVFSLMLP